AAATQIGKQLAHLYGGDLASTDWRHLGRLAGFTNQKPQRRRNGRGHSPWVKVLYAHAGLATQGAALLEAAEHRLGSSNPAPLLPCSWPRSLPPPRWPNSCSGLVIASPVRPCVEDSCRYPRRHQRALKLCRRTIVQCRVQALLVVDLLQELADGSADMRQIPI